MPSALQRFLLGFVHAGRGLARLVATQRNFRVHLVAALLVVAAAGHFRMAAWEWAILLLCIAVVMGMEAVNSALEALADRVCADRDPLIGRAKDMAAAGVLIVALAAAAVGLILFVPHL